MMRNHRDFAIELPYESRRASAVCCFLPGAIWFNAPVPSENTEQRKLAAIMFTDMVGYSALSQRNEALAQKQVSQGRLMIDVHRPGH